MLYLLPSDHLVRDYLCANIYMNTRFPLSWINVKEWEQVQQVEYMASMWVVKKLQNHVSEVDLTLELPTISLLGL